MTRLPCNNFNVFMHGKELGREKIKARLVRPPKEGSLEPAIRNQFVLALCLGVLTSLQVI